MKLSAHVDSSELDQKDGTAPYPSKWYTTRAVPLTEQIEIIRGAANEIRPVGSPERRVHILSGYRTPEYNAAKNGAPDSQHMYGRAADIMVDGMTAEELHGLIASLIASGRVQLGGLGMYSDKKYGVHIDIRPTEGRVAQWGANIISGLRNVAAVASRPSVAVPALLVLAAIAYALFATGPEKRRRHA